MQLQLFKGVVFLSLFGILGIPGLGVLSQMPPPLEQTPAIAQAEDNATTPTPSAPCEIDPESPACSTQQLLEQILQDRETRAEEALNQMLEEFPGRFGYDPRDYALDLHLSGDNFTIFGKSDWVKFRVKPEDGLIEVGHASATRDAFWGTMVWHDHDVLSVTFTLDEAACQVIADGTQCSFTGVDTIQINQNFITHHQLIKHGKWELNYIESNQEKGIVFRVPEDTLPEGTRHTSIAEINRHLCRLLPDSLDCQ
jgi:hypothetical protein